MKKLISLAALLLALMLPAAALGETIVTSFFPIYLFARNLTKGIDGLEVVCLTPPTAGCLHDYQLQTGDMKRLAQAQQDKAIFLINGAGMEAYLSNVQEAFPELPVADASCGVYHIELLKSTAEHNHDHGHAEADADDDHGHDEADADDEHGHEEDLHEYNAHIWLDASNAAKMVANLAEALIVRFPEHADAIRANRDDYAADLLELHDTLIAQRANLPEHADVITFHEAFPYFAEAYGLHVVGVLNHEPEDALSPRSLAALCRTVMDLGNPPLLKEPQYKDSAALTVSRETGAPIGVLDPIVTGPQGTPMEDIPLDYYQIVMLENMEELRRILGN